MHNEDMTQGKDLTGALLKAVSRSFYLTIYWLPSAMRPGVALGYMLARATDSVADTSTTSSERRELILHAMDKAISGGDSGEERAALLHDLATDMAQAQHNPAEKKLLAISAALSTVITCAFTAVKAKHNNRVKVDKILFICFYVYCLVVFHFRSISFLFCLE